MRLNDKYSRKKKRIVATKCSSCKVINLAFHKDNVVYYRPRIHHCYSCKSLTDQNVLKDTVKYYE